MPMPVIPQCPFEGIPSPETLRPLLEAALAVMEPNDPAKAELRVNSLLGADGYRSHSICFFFYGENLRRDCIANGKTPEECIEDFKAKYTPPPTKENRIAFHKAELAKLEGTR